MAKDIIPNPVASVLSSHRGLEPIGVIQDCLEKIKGLFLPILKLNPDDLLEALQEDEGIVHFWQNLSLIEDVVDLALQQFPLVIQQKSLDETTREEKEERITTIKPE